MDGLRRPGFALTQGLQHFKVYTSSYEGVVRCFDANAGKFLESAVLDEQDMLSYADIAWKHQTILGCHSNGGELRP
jgi:hypothetical protein